jgi:hypothetical protein
MSYNLPQLLQAFRTNRDGSAAMTINSLDEDLMYPDVDFHNNPKPIERHIFDEFNRKY